MYNDQYFSKEASIQAAFAIASEFIGPSEMDIAWCDRCSESVPMVTPEAAAILEKTTLRAILCRMAENEVHYRTSPLGASSICFSSLITGKHSPTDEEIETLPGTRHRFVRVNAATS